MIKTLDLRNHKGRVFFTTDIHGSFDLLHEKMREVGFDSEKDILILGGDSVDRGLDSKYVLDYLSEPWAHSVAGNHEQLFIEAFEEGWKGWATDCLLMNGGHWVALLEPEERVPIYEMFKSLPYGIELITPNEVIGIVHAQCPYDNWDEFKKITKAEFEFNGKAICQWARTNYDYTKTIQIKGVDRLMVGHTPTESGEVEVLGNTWYCDLGSFFRYKISFVQLM